MERRSVSIDAGGVQLEGELSLPAEPVGMVVFAHGSGSSRFSPRNRFVASILQGHELATLLMDLLTEEEGRVDALTRELRFDIALLADRVVGACDWIAGQRGLEALRVGLFGASTGAAAALIAAARRPAEIGAVVSRGGRPDLAGEFLEQVRAPTLLIVGGADLQVLELNRRALARLRCRSRLEIVAGASHLFEEPGTLEKAAELAGAWFRDCLGEVGQPGAKPHQGER